MINVSLCHPEEIRKMTRLFVDWDKPRNSVFLKLDFLVAVDFLCCDKLKAGVEERIKERIDETNWREVLTLSQDFIGLDNTTGAALEPIFK